MALFLSSSRCCLALCLCLHLALQGHPKVLTPVAPAVRVLGHLDAVAGHAPPLATTLLRCLLRPIWCRLLPHLHRLWKKRKLEHNQQKSGATSSSRLRRLCWACSAGISSGNIIKPCVMEEVRVRRMPSFGQSLAVLLGSAHGWKLPPEMWRAVKGTRKRGAFTLAVMLTARRGGT